MENSMVTFVQLSKISFIINIFLYLQFFMHRLRNIKYIENKIKKSINICSRCRSDQSQNILSCIIKILKFCSCNKNI